MLDLGKARSEARPAQPGSLAQQVRARAPLVQTYVGTVLGDVITCATPRELRRYRRAVTADVVVYSEWTARAVPPERYHPWFIGERAAGRESSLIVPRCSKVPWVTQRCAFFPEFHKFAGRAAIEVVNAAAELSSKEFLPRCIR